MTSTITRLPTGRLRIKEIDLCGWIGQAMPGEILEYHRGFLALDVTPQGTRLAERDRAELCRVARRAWWASEQRLVHLVQRRHGLDDYSYLAIARPKPMSVPASLASLLLEEVA
jgi:hypothetical protein